jgi:hypothetical protein
VSTSNHASTIHQDPTLVQIRCDPSLPAVQRENMRAELSRMSDALAEATTRATAERAEVRTGTRVKASCPSSSRAAVPFLTD